MGAPVAAAPTTTRLVSVLATRVSSSEKDAAWIRVVPLPPLFQRCVPVARSHNTVPSPPPTVSRSVPSRERTDRQNWQSNARITAPDRRSRTTTLSPAGACPENRRPSSEIAKPPPRKGRFCWDCSRPPAALRNDTSNGPAAGPASVARYRPSRDHAPPAIARGEEISRTAGRGRSQPITNEGPKASTSQTLLPSAEKAPDICG